MTIHIKKGEIKQTHIYTARKCPYAFEEYAKDVNERYASANEIQLV